MPQNLKSKLKMSITTSFFIILVLNFDGILAKLVIHPRNVTVIKYASLTLQCSTTLPVPVEWKFRPIGETKAINIYKNGLVLIDGGTYLVDKESAIGKYDLLIKNVQFEDAGLYSCVDNSGIGEMFSAELIILDAVPSCASNISLTYVIGANDCNVEPDYIELSCTAKYKGNVAPVLEWRNTRNGDVIDIDVSNHATINSSTNHLTLRANLQLNETYFMCQVDDSTASNYYGCNTSVISVLSLFNSTTTQKMVKSKHDVTCAADTPQQCNYEWIKIDNPRSEIIFRGSILHLEDPYIGPGNYQCIANCRLRDRMCALKPFHLELLSNDVHMERGDLKLAILVSVIVLLAVASILAIMFTMLWKEKNCRNKMFLGQRGPQQRNRENQERVDSYAKVIQKHLAKLVEHLDAENGLTDCLMSKGVLDAVQLDRLNNKSLWKTYRDQNQELLSNILLSKIKSNAECGQLFLDALKDTSQTHVANFITDLGVKHCANDCRILSDDELISFDKNRFNLTQMIDTNSNRFLDRLLTKGCITKQHKNRIKGHSNMADRNKELLNIMRRRSYADLLMFKKCLHDTNQRSAFLLLERQTVADLKTKTTELRKNNIVCLTNSETPINLLPKEIVESFLVKAAFQILRIHWKTKRHFITSGGYREFRDYMHHVMMDVSTTLSFVCFVWFDQFFKHQRSRKYMLKSLLIQQVQQSRAMIIERLNVQHGLLDKLAMQMVITSKEKRAIQKPDHKIVSKQYNELPKNLWPQLRIDEQNKKSNVKLLYCLRNKTSSDIQKFLRCIEETCQTHILNYLMSESSESFANVWPLDAELRKRLITRSLQLAEKMDPLVVMKEQVKQFPEGEQFQTRLYNYTGVELTNGAVLETSSLEINHEKTVLTIERERSTPQILPSTNKDGQGTGRELLNKANKDSDFQQEKPEVHIGRILKSTSPSIFGMNLIDRLYFKNCISRRNKYHIDQQPITQLKNNVLLQLLTNGSNAAFQTVAEYFQETKQQTANEYLVCNYLLGDMELLHENKKSEDFTYLQCVTSLDMNIYAICSESNRVFVFSNQSPFNRKKEEEIEINEMNASDNWHMDMTASTKLRSLFISDFHNSCLWKIQMPDKRVSKYPIDCQPNTMSITFSDQLLVLSDKKKEGSEVDKRDRESIDKICTNEFHLDIYAITPYVRRINRIPFPVEINRPWHVAQLSKGNFIISYKTNSEIQTNQSIDMISEMSVDGRIIRKFNYSAIQSSDVNILPHLAIDEDDRIFIADRYNHKVFLLDNQLKNCQVILTRELNQINWPFRLCYLREKHQLIVGNYSEFSVFSLMSS